MKRLWNRVSKLIFYQYFYFILFSSQYFSEFYKFYKLYFKIYSRISLSTNPGERKWNKEMRGVVSFLQKKKKKGKEFHREYIRWENWNRKLHATWLDVHTCSRITRSPTVTDFRSSRTKNARGCQLLAILDHLSPPCYDLSNCHDPSSSSHRTFLPFLPPFSSTSFETIYDSPNSRSSFPTNIDYPFPSKIKSNRLLLLFWNLKSCIFRY